MNFEIIATIQIVIIFLMKYLLIILSLTACTVGKHPYKAGVDPAIKARDQITCQQLANSTLVAQGLNNNILSLALMEDEANKCMQSLGYKLY